MMRCRAALEGLDDVHAPAATRARLGRMVGWRSTIGRLLLVHGLHRCHRSISNQLTRPREVSVLVPLASRPQCLMRWNPLGKTWIRNRLMNSSGLSVMVL